ncbi:YihY/virulence factor BrkB family protein [Haloechinothrix alba]|nr:YihY/virulence factor BrkB family protein [Haloechinothrix alba]
MRQRVHRPLAVSRASFVKLPRRTLVRAWQGNVFSEAAKTAFWQTLSLPPLLLAVLGSLGYMGDWFSPRVVDDALVEIIRLSRTIFSERVVTDFIEPTVADILTVGQAQIVSTGFLIALFAGSAATSAFVDAITAAHGQQGFRNEAWQRLLSLLLYIASLALLIVVLPVIAVGPDMLSRVMPGDWRPLLADWVGQLYFPTLGTVLVLGLATLYKLALPRKLPWHRGLPGAVLAMLIFLLSSSFLRQYLSDATATGYTYGAVATPIAFLLFVFFIGLAVIGGAHFNSAIEELWPSQPRRRQRGRWHRLERVRETSRTRAGTQQDGGGASAEAATPPRDHRTRADPR